MSTGGIYVDSSDFRDVNCYYYRELMIQGGIRIKQTK